MSERKKESEKKKRMKRVGKKKAFMQNRVM